MRLRHAVFGGAAVILGLLGGTQQGGSSAVLGSAARLVPPDRATTVPQDTTRAARPDSATAVPQDTTRAARPDSAPVVPRDTISAPSDTAASPARAPEQDTVAAAPPVDGLTLGLRSIPFPYPIDLRSELPNPADQRPELRTRLRSWADAWFEDLREQARGWQAAMWLESRPIVAVATSTRTEPPVQAETPEPTPVESTPAPADTTLETPPSPPGAEPAPERADPSELLPDVFQQYADLGLAIQGRVELGGGWNRFRPCNVSLALNCDPSAIPTLKPDIQFGARVGGTISDRIHVAVDYDNRREFDAANNINVFYQGLEDEILQRVEVGDVTFPLPQSRYLTQGIPAGNFGFRTAGQMGPIDFQAVWAQQKGDLGVRELQVGGGGQGFEQSAITILDDADYERGRFFFLFNPRNLSGYPHIDIQRLIATDAPPAVRPNSVVKVYRYEVVGLGLGAQVPEGFITAVAVAADTFQTEPGAPTIVADTLTGLFRPLVDGEDYILHRSGLWIQLRNQLRDQEGLAITYIASDGSEIGTFDAEAVSDAHVADPENVAPPVLAMIKGLNQRPGTATWAREMHNIYRISASPGVVEASVDLVISQGDPEVGNTFRTAPDGSQLEFLKIFGLDDDPTDNNLDISQIYEFTGGNETVPGPGGAYIVIPTLEPFRVPPPLRNVPGLSGEPFPLDPGDRNASIYDETNDELRRGSNLYLLTISFRQRFEGFLSTISLGVGGVRENSERIVIDGQELVRGEDYAVDYDIGQVELREPERWFANNPSARVQVTFEQKPLFQLAPTSVFGLQAHYGLGTTGDINLIGLSQTERTLQTRPELGLEPSAVQLGGLSGRLNLQPQWLSNLVAGLPGAGSQNPSTLTVDGEIALSMPTTNTQGVTYVEDFEGGPGFQIGLLSRSWRLGSAPSTILGAEMVAPPAFALENAAELVWQDQYVVATTEGSVIVGGLRPFEVDSQILIQGQSRPEPVLTLTARSPENRLIAPNPNPPPGPAWGSLTSVISSSGQDFTNIEFLEFYVAVADVLADSVNLIIDLGTVSEDGFGIDSLGQPSGIGALNREVDPPRVWSDADDTGLWDSGCEAEPRTIAYPLGSIDANCTKRNGLEDSEDLNQNQILDTDERFFRYTVRIGDRSSPYFVRDANQLGEGVRFRLFRVPLRQPDHRERVTDAEFQNIRHLRFTWVTESDNRLILARARFQGSRWLKRARNGVLEGISDTASVASPDALVEVGPVSTVDPRYVSPPGVTDQVANQTDQLNFGGGTAFNEQSLSIRFNNVGADQRGEVFLQYAQTPRDFLAYRNLLVWALGFEGPWGKSGQPLRFLVKLGEDSRNYYLYQTPLTEVPPGASPQELRAAWLPELVVDFERLVALRTAAEEVMLRAGGLPGDTTLRLWDVDVFEDGDSSYAVVIGQRSRAPNLAAIRQISLGVYNSGTGPPVSGELWVDDMRLAAPVDNTGVVGQLNIDLRGGDLFGLRMSYASENPYFRQLAQEPGFRSSRSLLLGGNLRMGRMLPESWGLNMPVNVNYSRTSQEPLLLPRTDIFVERLPGLRTPDTRNLRFDVSLSRLPNRSTPWVGWFVDNSSLRLSHDRRKSQTSRSITESTGLAAAYSFRSNVSNVSLPLLVGDLGLRLTPTTLQFSTSYTDAESETRRFEEIIALPGDSAAAPIRRLDERLLSNLTLNFEPVSALTGRLTASQARELVPADRLVSGEASRRLLEAERSSLLGIDLGWETGRTLDMNWTYRPNITRWLLPQATLDTRFRRNRGASFVTEQEGDTVLTSDFNGSRSVRLSAGFNAPLLLRGLAGDPQGGVLGGLFGVIDWLDILTASWASNLNSRFQREDAEPDLGYQFGFGRFNAFRGQGGATASRVTDSKVLTLSSGLSLPLAASFNFDYSNNDVLNWTPISQNESRGTTWPSVGFTWNRLPLPSFLDAWVTNLTLRAGYTVSKNRSEVVGADQVRLSERTSVPFNASLSLTTEWTVSYNRTTSDDERRDPTGITLGNSTNQAVQLTGRVRPLSREGRFRNPVRISLQLRQDDQDQCRQVGAVFGQEDGAGGGELPACEPFNDRRIRTIDLTVATDVPPFSLGLQGSWRDTQSEIGQRAGSTQLEISLFGQFLLETGEIR